jgi:copper resistance protein C
MMIFFLMAIPNLVSAHAELTGSQPQEGETVKQSIDTLTLQFGEDVEKFISLTITNENGDSIPVDSPSISGKTILVMTKKPLPDGDYTVKWELVSADGHNSTGQLTFSVQQGNKNKAKSDQPTKTNMSQAAQNTQKAVADHSTLYIGIIAVLIVILVIGLLTAFRKKQK